MSFVYILYGCFAVCFNDTGQIDCVWIEPQLSSKILNLFIIYLSVTDSQIQRL